MKELLSASRRGRTYWGRVIYVAVVGFILYQFWSTRISQLSYATPSMYAELSRSLFNNFFYFQMIMVTLAALGGAAERIIREDANKTLGLLLLTPLTPVKILYSKWRASMIQSGTLILCGVPVTAVCVFLGGVGWEELLWSFSLTCSLAALGAAFGLRASAIHHSVPKAILMAMLYMVGYSLLPMVLIVVTIGFGFYIIAYVHPLYAAGFLVNRGLTGVEGYCWMPATLVSFAMAWWIVKKQAQRVRARAIAPPPTPPNFVFEQQNLAGRFKIPIRVGNRPSRSYREVWESDPLLWKELITHASARWSRETKLGYAISGCLFVFLCWGPTLGESQATLLFLGLLFTVLSVANGAALFAPDKEGRRMDMLLCSPIPSSALVRSKLVAGLVAPDSVRAMILGFITVCGFSYWSLPFGVLIHLIVFFGFQLFVYSLAAAASLRSATIQGAALSTVAVLCALLLFLPLVVSLAFPATGGDLRGPWALLSAVDPAWVLHPIRSPDSLDLAEALSRVALFLGVYGSATLAALGWVRWSYDRIMGRI